MPAPEKPGRPPTRATIRPTTTAPVASPAELSPSAPSTATPASQPRRSLESAIVGAVKSSVAASVIEKRPYLKYAFTNPYNISLFLGALAAAGLTLNPVLAVAAIGLEALWLLYAPDSKRLRHLLWDPRFEEVREALLEQERAERLQLLGPHDQERVHALVERQRIIRRLAAGNPSLTSELLKAELVKTDRLVEAFLDMAVNCTRYEQYLASVDLDALARERTRWEVNSKSGQDGDPAVQIARQNLAIILKRLDKMQEITRYLTVARGQLDLIDNSFQLIADQIVTMQSPQQLSGQLDELLDGVESIRQSAVDTDRLLSTMGIESTV
jgi:hypothetical protein